MMVSVVFAMLDGVDHRAGTHEQQCLENRVGHQVESGGDIRANPHRHDHVPKLADCGISKHFLNIALGEGNRRRKKGSERADGGDHLHRQGEPVTMPADRNQREHPQDQVDTGGNHRRGMDHRADRGRAFHRVGQPGVQRELGALPDRPGEDQQAHRPGDGQTAERGDIREGRRFERGERRLVVENLAEVERPGEAVQPGDPQEHQHVGHTGSHEGFDPTTNRRDSIRLIGVDAVVPEPDQRVRAESHHLPADEKQQQVVGDGENQHRSGKQRDEGHKARLPRAGIEFDQRPPRRVDHRAIRERFRVFDLRPVGAGSHVAGRVDEDHRRRERDEEQHHRAQRIDQHAHPQT